MRHRKLILFLAGAVLICLAIFAGGGAAAEGNAKWPESPGKEIKKSEKLKVDMSNASEGYFVASVQNKTKKALKLRVSFKGETLTYDLKNTGDTEVFPFQMGSGSYEITLWENVSGKKYAAAGKITVTVKLAREDGAFLYPNQYVFYTVDSKAFLKAEELCKGKTDKEAFDAVCGFMKTQFVYDFVKAATIKPGVLPDIDGSYDKHMGVCQDLSAIMACMLRTQGIPCKLMIGYADKNYHAWTVTIIDGEEVFFDPTAALNAISKPKNYTVERWY